MKTLFDLKRLAVRTDRLQTDNPRPFLCCKACGENIQIRSAKLASEIDKIKDVVCHVCHGQTLVWSKAEPTAAFRYQLMGKRVADLALQVENLKVQLGLQQVKISAAVPEEPAQQALSEFDNLLGKAATIVGPEISKGPDEATNKLANVGSSESADFYALMR